jgi:predicted ATPase/DNA-binding SARP family transcriptional activator
VERARIGILGPLQVHVGDEPVAVGAAQLRRLLAILVLAEGRPVTSAALAEHLWPDEDGSADARPQDPAATIRSYASRLRQLLPEEVGPYRDERGLRLEIASADIDAAAFETLLSAAAAELPTAPDWALSTLTSALKLWRGAALAEFRDEPWATGPAVRLEELRLVALERTGDARLALGDHLELAGELSSLVVEHPFRERLWAQLMISLYRSGRQADALRAYGRLRDLLVEELGVDPSRELVELESAVLRQDPALDWRDPAELVVEAARATVGGGRPTEHPAGSQPGQGPDLSEPAEPHAASPPALVRNLPAERTSFVGRGAELDDLCLIVGVESPLVTVVGPGGTGKTRLASATARLTAARFGRACFVPLAGTTAGLVAETVAEALGVQVAAGMRAAAAVVANLSAQAALIVLDNCEHVVQEVAELVDELLTDCPEVAVLATSREPLMVRGEQIFRLSPLGLPDPPATPGNRPASVIGESEAVRLFVQRGAQARRGFTLTDANAEQIAALCRQVDGIPLALELAAARLSGMPIDQLVELIGESLDAMRAQVRGGEARQRTLRGALDWSHNLLSEQERMTLRRLAEFRGGFDLDAALMVVADDHFGGHDVGEALSALVRQSMVEMDETTLPARYRLLEPIRQYAHSKLEEADETVAIRTAHLLWCRALLAPMRDRGLRGPKGGERLARLDRELENLRAAIRYALDAGLDVESAEIVTSPRSFWTLRGHYNEASAYCDELLERDLPPSWVARTLEMRAKIASYRDVDEITAAEFDRAIEIFSSVDDPLGLALARFERARIGQGHESVAVRRSNWAVVKAELEALGDSFGIADVLQQEAWLNRGEGDLPGARQKMAEVLAVYRELGDAQGTGMSLEALGTWEVEAGEIGPAAAHLEEALGEMAGLGFRQSVARLGVELGEIAAHIGDLETALAKCTASVALYRELGARNGTAWALEKLGLVQELREELEQAEQSFRMALEIYLAISSDQEAANGCTHIARMALRRGDLAEAATMLSRALELFLGPAAEEDLVANFLVTAGQLAARRGNLEVAGRLESAGIGWRRAHGMSDLPLELRGWLGSADAGAEPSPPAMNLDEAIAEVRELLTRATSP